MAKASFWRRPHIAGLIAFESPPKFRGKFLVVPLVIMAKLSFHKAVVWQLWQPSYITTLVAAISFRKLIKEANPFWLRRQFPKMALHKTLGDILEKF